MNVLRFALHNFNFLIKQNPDLEYLRESVVISALFHDVCKSNYYIQQEKFRKDAEGKWEKYLAWVTDDKFPYGHGEKSVYIISKFMKLTDAEAMAIRWHMGATELSVNISGSAQYFAYNDAINHPLVRLIHCADMLSMTIEEKR
jgi:HD superfamily phosphohydrolase YqeK